MQDEFRPPWCGLYKVHDKLSEGTEVRKRCLPYEGTLDAPVLFLITGLNIFTVAFWLVSVERKRDIVSVRGTEQDNVQLIAVVFALVELAPGLLFFWCAFGYSSACACLLVQR